jgi:hypothetical protein
VGLFWISGWQRSCCLCWRRPAGSAGSAGCWARPARRGGCGCRAWHLGRRRGGVRRPVGRRRFCWCARVQEEEHTRHRQGRLGRTGGAAGGAQEQAWQQEAAQGAGRRRCRPGRTASWSGAAALLGQMRREGRGNRSVQETTGAAIGEAQAEKKMRPRVRVMLAGFIGYAGS